MSTKNYNAVSGTGVGNEWNNEGATVGDDQSAVGGTESTVSDTNPSTKRLSVPIENETDLSIRSSVITNVRLYVSAKGIGETGHQVYLKCSSYVNNNWYDGSINFLTTNFVYYYYDWAVNPNTSIFWTWPQIDSIQCGCLVGVSIAPYSGSFYADHTYITVTYTEREQLGINNMTLAFR